MGMGNVWGNSGLQWDEAWTRLFPNFQNFQQISTMESKCQVVVSSSVRSGRFSLLFRIFLE